MARTHSSPRLLLLMGLALLALVMPVACTSKTRTCAVTQWHEGCNALPLGLDDDRYATALAYGGGYRCSIEPIAGASAEEMDLRIETANALLPLMFGQAAIPLAVLEERHFQQDLERMAREISCPDPGA